MNDMGISTAWITDWVLSAKQPGQHLCCGFQIEPRCGIRLTSAVTFRSHIRVAERCAIAVFVYI